MSNSARDKLLRDFRKSRERPNTQKQNDFLEKVKETGDPLAAAKSAGYSAPSQAVRLNMAKPSIREAVDSLMDETGCDTKTTLQVIGNAMQADKPDFITRDGDVIEGGPDHRIRLDAAEKSLKLKGAYPKTEEKAQLHLHAHMVKELAEEHSFEELTHMMQIEVKRAESSGEQEQQSETPKP